MYTYSCVHIHVYMALSMTYYAWLIEIKICMHTEQRAVQVRALRSEVSLLIPTLVVHTCVCIFNQGQLAQTHPIPSLHSMHTSMYTCTHSHQHVCTVNRVCLSMWITVHTCWWVCVRVYIDVCMLCKGCNEVRLTLIYLYVQTLSAICHSIADKRCKGGCCWGWPWCAAHRCSSGGRSRCPSPCHYHHTPASRCLQQIDSSLKTDCNKTTAYPNTQAKSNCDWHPIVPWLYMPTRSRYSAPQWTFHDHGATGRPWSIITCVTKHVSDLQFNLHNRTEEPPSMNS